MFRPMTRDVREDPVKLLSGKEVRVLLLMETGIGARGAYERRREAVQVCRNPSQFRSIFASTHKNSDLASPITWPHAAGTHRGDLLLTGDYDIGGDPCRVLERKTGSDFLSQPGTRTLIPATDRAAAKTPCAHLITGGRPAVCKSLPDASRKYSRGTHLHHCDPARADPAQQRTGRVCAPGLRCCEAVPGWANGSQPCHSRSCRRTAPGDSIRAADADRLVPAGHRPHHRSRCLCALSQLA